MPTPPGYPASFASFAFRLDCPPSLPTTSVDQNAKAYSHPPTAQSCDFPQTEQSSDRFINWAARIILRHRSFLLSINTNNVFGRFAAVCSDKTICLRPELETMKWMAIAVHLRILEILRTLLN